MVFVYSSRDQRKCMHYLPTLRLFFPGGVCNEYRLRDGCVEFRWDQDRWRVLDESDIELHYRFDTEVSRWLRRHVLDSNPFLVKD